MNLPQFYNCPKKIMARQKTIIDTYRTYFHHKLPPIKQYWTMCASQTDGNGVFKDGSELGQMLSSGLIEESQFFGCDIDSEVIRLNSIAKPNAHWFCNDFLTQMKRHNGFNPAIVNADLLNLKYHASNKISEILSFVHDIDIGECLVVCNIMLNNPHDKTYHEIEDIMSETDKFLSLLEDNRSFCYIWRSQRWTLHPETYIYNGSGIKAKTYLASFMFVKKS